MSIRRAWIWQRLQRRCMCARFARALITNVTVLTNGLSPCHGVLLTPSLRSEWTAERSWGHGMCWGLCVL